MIHGRTSRKHLSSSNLGDMDVLSDLLHRARAGDALVRQVIQRQPWAVTYADPPPLTVVATLSGHLTIRLEDAGAAPVVLGAGDIALISAVAEYTIADSPSTPARYVIQDGRKQTVDGGEVPAEGLRTWRPAPTAAAYPAPRPRSEAPTTCTAPWMVACWSYFHRSPSCPPVGEPGRHWNCSPRRWLATNRGRTPFSFACWIWCSC